MNPLRTPLGSLSRPEWQPLPRPGVVGVVFRVLVSRPGIVIAGLKFSAHAAIDEHSAPFEIDVVCLDGEGYVSVAHAASRFRCGECITWPAHIDHRLWTEGGTMETLMLEHRDA